MVLEGRDRIGGRVWTDRSQGIAADLGASWIHGPIGNPITELKDRYNMKTYETNDDSLRRWFHNGTELSETEIDASQKRWRELKTNFKQKRNEDRASNRPDISLYEGIEKTLPNATKTEDLNYHLSSNLEFNYGGPVEDLSFYNYDSDSVYPGKDVLFPEG